MTSCSYISGPEGLFPETKNKFFEEELASDLNLPSSDLTIQKEDHYPPLPKREPYVQEYHPNQILWKVFSLSHSFLRAKRTPRLPSILSIFSI